jgi:predicted  nucleic acid-binding Zn-ribbon protein
VAKDDEFQTRLLRHLTSMLESQRGLNAKLAEAIDRTGSFDKEVTKLTRHINALREEIIEVRTDSAGIRTSLGGVQSEVATLRSDLANFRSETAQRFNALSIRLDELENASERNSDLIKEIKIDAMSHYNEILNAVQSGTINGADIRDLDERIRNVERRLAP